MWQDPTVIAKHDTASAGNARLHTHDVDAGHWLHAEKPGEVFQLMQDNGVQRLLSTT